MTRHPAAIALEAWLRSEQGVLARQGSASGDYLTNRLSTAFAEGWRAAEQRVKDALDKAVTHE